MGALKALVVFMGILIVAGLGLLTYAVIGGLPNSGSGGFGQADVTLPPGCTVVEAALDEGTLILRADGPADRGCRQIILLNPENGRERGRVMVRESN